jgi:hypothetical protein
MAVGLQQSEDLMARLQALPLPRGPSDLIYLVLDVHLLLVFAHTQVGYRRVTEATPCVLV